MNLQENFLALEPLLAARLTEQLADLVPKVKVLHAADLAGVSEEQQFTPAVHLLYRGHRTSETPTNGNAARIEQTWLAVVATRNAKTLRSGEAARVDAGLIARRVLRALMGFKPALLSKPLRLAEGIEPGYSGGFIYLPLAFSAELTLTNFP
ncbi:MAG: hypothetical protein ACKVOO_12425 [Burkholderiaceae bacterium]